MIKRHLKTMLLISTLTLVGLNANNALPNEEGDNPAHETTENTTSPSTKTTTTAESTKPTQQPAITAPQEISTTDTEQLMALFASLENTATQYANDCSNMAANFQKTIQNNCDLLNRLERSNDNASQAQIAIIEAHARRFAELAASCYDNKSILVFFEQFTSQCDR